MTWKPHATVAVVAEDEQGRFLLVEEESHGKVVFNQPAGHIEEGEAILDAVRREALEETGWQVEPESFLGVYTYKAPANGVTYYRFCYAAKAIRQITTELGCAARWCCSASRITETAGDSPLKWWSTDRRNRHKMVKSPLFSGNPENQ